MSPTKIDGPKREPGHDHLPDQDEGQHLRWIRWTFVAMVVFCLLLGAWVWFEILGLP